MNFLTKKGDVWISAAIYFGLGMVVLSIVLAAGLPVIKKLQDKNTILQTKEVFFTLDNNIREVARGGPGTQRLVRMQVGKGTLMVHGLTDQITWTYDTKAPLSEPGQQIAEGHLLVLTTATQTSAMWQTALTLDYGDIVDLDGTLQQTFQGGTNVLIRNNGESALLDNLVNVTISETL